MPSRIWAQRTLPMVRQCRHELSALCFKIVLRCKEKGFLLCLPIARNPLTMQISFDFETRKGATKRRATKRCAAERGAVKREPSVVKASLHRPTLWIPVDFSLFLAGPFIFDTRTRSLNLWLHCLSTVPLGVPENRRGQGSVPSPILTWRRSFPCVHVRGCGNATRSIGG